MTGWQPIETAPKDGTPVLVWVKNEAEPDESPDDYPQGYAIASYRGRFGIWEGLVGGRLVWELAPTGRAGWVEPLFWMPLPEPPETAG